MDFELGETLEQVRAAVNGAMSKFSHRKEELRERVHKKREFIPELWDALVELGLLGAMVPTEHGGNGMGLLALTVACEELATIGFGSGLMILTAMDSCAIARHGSEELKARVLPRIAEGKLKLAFALTEPDAGSNTFRITTHARRDGDVYRIKGQKTFITGADIADKMLLVARTTTREELEKQGLSRALGISLFLVDPKAKGVELRAIPTHGIEGMNQYQIFLDDVVVPVQDRVGEEGEGLQALFGTLNPERILAASTANGITEYLLKKACSYARERRVFKEKPIGSYQGIQHPLAEIKIEQEAAKLLTYRAAWAWDQGKPPAVTGNWANMAKYTAAETAIKACDRAIQTLGGYGFSEEYGVIYLWDTVRLLRTAPISKEMILNYVAEHVLELPKSY
jgi:acyl-CoA dehydrogenase